MKNASQIITTLQCKPQFRKLLEHKCIQKLKSSLLLSVQNSIRYGYIKNGTLYLVMSVNLNKMDIHNIITMIKSILNSPMIMASQTFNDCLDMGIKDVVCYVDHKPKQKKYIYFSNSFLQTYTERATGNMEIEIKDEKLKELSEAIFEIIREKHDTSRDD